MKKYLEKAKKYGVSWAKIIHPKNVVTAEWVRLKCQYSPVTPSPLGERVG